MKRITSYGDDSHLVALQLEEKVCEISLSLSLSTQDTL